VANAVTAAGTQPRRITFTNTPFTAVIGQPNLFAAGKVPERARDKKWQESRRRMGTELNWSGGRLARVPEQQTGCMRR
jgi:hypothetical protein